MSRAKYWYEHASWTKLASWTTTTLRKYLNLEVEVGMQGDEAPFKVKDLIDRFHHLCFFVRAYFKRF